jgi:hypothetical protein
MQIPKFPASAGQMAALHYGSFPGYSLADDPGELPGGFLVAGSQDIDLTRKLGALAKRYGIEAQLTTPPAGTTGIMGLHTYRRNSGDIVLMGYGTGLYRLSGAPNSLTENTFATGTHNNTEVAAGKLTLDADESLLSPGTMADSNAVGTAAWATPDNAKASDDAYAAVTQEIAVVSSVKSSGTLANDAAVGTKSWSNPSYAASSNNSRAVSTGSQSTTDSSQTTYSNYLKASNFAFNIPATAHIVGIMVSIERQAQYSEANTHTRDYQVSIVKADGSIGSANKADTSTNWPTSDAYKNYGGATDLWDETWTPADINDADFGAVLETRFYSYNSPGAPDAQVDHISITVYYTEVSVSHYLKATNFGFAIPTGSAIDGIKVEIEKKNASAGTVSDNAVKIVKADGTIGTTNKAAVGNWSAVEAYAVYGGTTDKWDETWTPAAINDADFGVVLAVNLDPAAGTAIASIDHIRITVYYTAPGDWLSPVYDLNHTPITNVLEWVNNVPAGSTFAINARGSEDGVNWGAWNVIQATGDGLPLTRFVQVQIYLTSGGTAPTVTSFTISDVSQFTAATSIKSSLTGNRIRFVDYEDVCYFVEGGRPQRYDGTTVSNVGFTDAELPTAPTLTASATAGSPNGAYYGRVTFVNEYGCESNGGAVSAIVNPASKKIDWTNIAVDATGRATSRKLYRTKAGGSIYYYVTTINDNTTTTYAGDNLADADLITPLELDNDAPPTANIVLAHKTYVMYVSKDNPARLYFSKPGLPDNVPEDAYKQFPGHIKGVQTYADALVVGGDNFLAVVYGSTWDASPTIDNTVSKVLSEYEGPVSHEAMVQCFSSKLGDILVFPTRYGLKYLTPGFQENSVRSTPLSYRVQEIFDQAVNRANMAALFWKDRLFIAITHYGNDTPITINNKIMVFDFRTEQWCPPWNIYANAFAIANNKAYIGDSDSAQVYEFEKGTDDAGANIHSIAVMRPEYAKAPHLKKRFRQLRLTMLENSDTTSLEVKPEIDGVSSTLTPGAVSTWGNQLTSPRQKINLSRGYKYQLTIEDDSVLDWVITDIVTEYERGE